MKISVVIPTYKRPQLLLRCLDALSQQNLSSTEFEIIVVSDGPDEDTMNMLDSFAHKTRHTIRSFSTAVKAGPADARNFGWKSAIGKLIAFTDDDCIPDPQWLTSMLKSFTENGSSMVAFSGNTIVPISNPPTDYELNISHLATAEFITANCACTREALELVGGFDENFKMAWREDSDLQFKFIRQGIPVLKVANAKVTHPVRKHKWGVSLKEEKKGVFNVLLYKKYPDLYRSKIGGYIPLSYYLAFACLIMATAGLILGLSWLVIVSFLLWLALTVAFALKRLKHTSRSFEHVSEMIITSFAIPPLSIYYRWKGVFKYKVFLP
jgi:GT2 family glycosyltransferase